jgi:hypothetical protein
VLYGGIGFSWRYDGNYKVRINTGSSDNKIIKKKKKMKEEQKRTDQIESTQ